MKTTDIIEQHKSATISLHELERLCGAPGYSALVAEIRGFVGEGLLRPMGKDTNGMAPPLHSRYRICRVAQGLDDVKNEIMRLGPEFHPSGYLANIPLYMKHRDLLQRLILYARNNGAELLEGMSKNERAYAIWGNEKQLDDAVCRGMLRFTGWESKLNYYHTPEPFLDYLCNGADTKAILILENKDIWFSLRKIFMERKSPCLLYGTRFDGLLYGEGKKITRAGALEEYAKEGFSSCPAFSYWGDLDYEGISIFLKVSAFPAYLFTPGYMAMLEHGGKQVLTSMRAAQQPPPGMGGFLKYFDMQSAAKIQTVLDAGRYIPQEICSYPRLSRAVDAIG